MTELLDLVVGQIVGNISTVVIGALLYYNFLLFEDYFKLIVWAFLLSQALRGAKEKVVAILENVSNDSKIARQGLLRVLYAKLYEYLFLKSSTNKRSLKVFLLDNGIFIFAYVGAVSVILRMITWVTFVYSGLLLLLLVASLLSILDHRIFHYRYFISDKNLVSTVLIVGMFVTVSLVMIFLGTESFIEGTRAASDISEWIQLNVINDERTRKIWTEQVAKGRSMVTTTLEKVEADFNETMWWPPVKSLALSFYSPLDIDSNEPMTVSSHGMEASRLEQFSHNFGNYTLLQIAELVRDRVVLFNLTSTQLTDWTSTGLEMSRLMFGSIANFIVFLVSLLAAFVSLGVRAVFFVTSLFYLLSTNVDPVERFAYDLLPVSPERKPEVLRSLRRSIEGAFFLPMKLSSVHAIVTLISFSLLDADFIYLATFLTFFLSAIPIIPPYLVCVPWACTICWTSSVFRGVTLFLIHYFVFSIIDDALYEKNLGILNSYVSALSVVFGVYVFGLEGVVFGPLLVCSVGFAYDLSEESFQKARGEGEGEGDPSDVSPTRSFFRSLSFSQDGPPTNIFSNAFRAMAEKSSSFSTRSNLNNKAKKESSSSPRFTFDLCESGTVSMVLMCGEIERRMIRFVASKSWSMNEFLQAICLNVKIQLIDGVYAEDGSEIVSVLHIRDGERLLVRTPDEVWSRSHRHFTSAVGSLHALKRRSRVEKDPYHCKNTRLSSQLKKMTKRSTSLATTNTSIQVPTPLGAPAQKIDFSLGFIGSSSPVTKSTTSPSKSILHRSNSFSGFSDLAVDAAFKKFESSTPIASRIASDATNEKTSTRTLLVGLDNPGETNSHPMEKQMNESKRYPDMHEKNEKATIELETTFEALELSTPSNPSITKKATPVLLESNGWVNEKSSSRNDATATMDRDRKEIASEKASKGFWHRLWGKNMF